MKTQNENMRLFEEARDLKDRIRDHLRNAACNNMMNNNPDTSLPNCTREQSLKICK
jgi:hypothetical protein